MTNPCHQSGTSGAKRFIDSFDLDWHASWIAPIEGADSVVSQRPVHQLAAAINIQGDIVSAQLHVTAHGIYEMFVNSTRVGDQELTPGWTAYRSRLQVQTFDVTAMLRPGENVVGALLSDGWWRGQNGSARRINDYGATTALLAQLHAITADGRTHMWGTGASWRSTPSHILRADLIAGEIHDLRQRKDWKHWRSWALVRVEHHGFDQLVISPAPAVRRIQQIRPASVRWLAPGRWVVDVGQNINGWVRLARLGAAGTQITLTHGEWLDQDGDLALTFDPRVPFQTDIVFSAGIEGDVFEPRHSTKGFQYVRVEGSLDELTADDLSAVVVHSDLRRIGDFSCSDERINALHRMVDWSFRANACDIPTDCPTRERLGWTGDWQIFVETAAFLYDIAGFNRKWLRDLAAEQRSDGKVTNTVPEPHPGDGRPPAFWPTNEGSSGWGDAAVHVPWVHYQATGDTEILTEQYESAKLWVDYAVNAAATQRHPTRQQQLIEPQPHESYLWDSGWHFGEWLEVGETVAQALAKAAAADPAPVATAYLYRSVREFADMACILGRHEDAQHYAEIAACVADAWRIEFLAADGKITPGTQATYARALAFDLIPAELRDVVARQLVNLIHEADNHLSTGFLTTPYLLPILARTGHLDVAYDLLFQDDEPSWLVMVDRGATTVWEEWCGVDADGKPHASLNHYSKGTVISFLHQYVAGLKLLEPGYRRFRVAPQPGDRISSARVHHDSPHGRIEARWTVTDQRFTLDVDVPSGTTAELILPDGGKLVVTAGHHAVAAVLPNQRS